MILEKLTEWFSNSPWLNVLFLILAILSIILAFHFYYKSIKEKRPCYCSTTVSLFHANPIISNEIEIKYHGTEIENLSLTKIAFWNQGKEPIRRSDIPTNSPFLIKPANGIIIYDFHIIYENKKNNISIQRNSDNQLVIQFDFLDFLDGFTLNIFHNKIKGKKITIDCSLIGSKELNEGAVDFVYTSKIEFLNDSVEYLINKNGYFLKFIGFLWAIPVLFINLPFYIILAPLDFINYRKNRNIRKKFLLEGN